MAFAGDIVEPLFDLGQTSCFDIMPLADSKYPGGAIPSVLGPIPCAYDPSGDENEPMNEEDLLHDPRAYVAYIDPRPAGKRGKE